MRTLPNTDTVELPKVYDMLSIPFITVLLSLERATQRRSMPPNETIDLLKFSSARAICELKSFTDLASLVKAGDHIFLDIDDTLISPGRRF